MSKIIGLAGLAGSSKSTCAEYFEKYGFKKDAYARVMKQAVSIMFGIPMEKLLGDITVKSEIDPYWGMSYREILQKFCTEACRNTFGGEVWEKALWRQYDYPNPRPSGGLVIEDVRFRNEAEAIKQRGGIIIEVVRASATPKRPWYKRWFKRPHASERLLPRHLVDLTIHNDYSKEQLFDILDRILGSLA